MFYPKGCHLNKYERLLRDDFKTDLESIPILKKLIQHIEINTDIYIFGGWCRDRLHEYKYHTSVNRSDIDLVINGELDNSLFKDALRNHFGGFRLELPQQGRLIDFWTLEQTYAFRKDLLKPTVENLLKSTVFDVNSVLFNINSFKLINGLAIQAIDNQQLGFNCKGYLNDFPDLQAYRALFIARKLNYRLEPGIVSFVSSIFRNCSFDEFVRAVCKFRQNTSKNFIRELYEEFLERYSTS